MLLRNSFCRTLAAVMTMTGTSLLSSGQDQHTCVSDLPAIHINTLDGNAITSKDTYVPTTLRYVEPSGIVTVYDSVRVRGRGSATWTLEKKPYKLKFRNKVRMLGSTGANGKKWNLMANHTDKTLIRNAVASCIGSFTGQKFTPGYRFVDLSVNGAYVGTYQLTDQIDIRKKRVDITEQPEILTSLSNITGGYLLEIDGGADPDEGTVFTTAKGVKIAVKSPDEDVIAQSQTDYIAAHIQKFENALFADNWLNPVSGYRRYCDMPSLISWYIASELTGNPSAFSSTYFYKEKDDDKLYWGPMWDYEMAFNNDDRHGDLTESLIISRNYNAAKSFPWFERVNQDPAFFAEVSEAYQTLLGKGLKSHVLQFIDDTSAAIEQSRMLNFGIYPIDAKVHRELVLFSSYAEGIRYLKDFIDRRIDFLSQRFADRAVGKDPETSLPEFPALQNSTDDYYLVFSESDNTLRFIPADATAQQPVGTFAIASVAGTTVISGQISERIHLDTLGHGVHIISWTDMSGRTRAAKFTIK